VGCGIYKNKERLYAYFAGAIDAEGFISIQKTIRKNKSRTPHAYYNAKIGLTNTNNTAVLNLLKENFGGSIYSYKPSNPNARPWSVWQTSDKHARDILVVLQPYFMAKKRQAEIIIDFVNICDAQWQLIKRTQKAPYHITTEMIALREHYWEQVAELNSIKRVDDIHADYQKFPVEQPGKIFLGAIALAPALTYCLQGLESLLCGAQTAGINDWMYLYF
jgi:hypothetical protein